MSVSDKTSLHPYHGGSPSGYLINGEESPILIFVSWKNLGYDQSDSSNDGHPIRFMMM